MKKIIPLLGLVLLFACSSNNDIEAEKVAINFTFSHSWQDTALDNTDFNDFKFTTEDGDTISITRLRYVVSDVRLTHQSGAETVLSEHGLIDVTNNDLSFISSPEILAGNYTAVSIRFGLSAEYNVDDSYPDLNTAVFNVGDMLGGGYHYMQFDGEYLENGVQMPFNYHFIPAADTNNLPITPLDTSIQLNLGAMRVTGGSTVTINLDLYEWFSNPNTWDLNVLNTSLMPNFNAQLQMQENATSVFSLVSITP